MPTLRERFTSLLLGDQKKQLQLAIDMLDDAYHRQIMPMTGDKLKEQLKELDPQLADLISRMYETSNYSSTQMTNEMRLRLVYDSRSLYLWDVITKRVIDLRTDFGFGLRVQITCEDEAADEVWQSFWKDPRNACVLGDRYLANMSTAVGTDGEIFLTVFTSKLDGESQIRVIKTEEITELITDPDDKNKVLYYHRAVVGTDGITKDLYYKDWLATPSDLERAKLPEGAKVEGVNVDSIEGDKTGTDVVMLQAAYEVVDGRGIPVMTAGAAWSRAYKNFQQDRAAVQRNAAMYVEKITAKGGQRVIDSLKTSLQSSLSSSSSTGYDTNPPAVAASVWLQNEAVNRERMPVGTGAGDAQQDGAALLAMAGLSGGVFAHWLGKGEAFRLATSTSMETPVLRAFNRYQQFWASVLRDVVKIVLMFAEQYGGKTFASYNASVSMDALLQKDPAQVEAFMASVVSASTSGVLDPTIAANVISALTLTGLQTLGVSNPDAIMNPEQVEEMAEKATTETGEGYAQLVERAAYDFWAGNTTAGSFAYKMDEIVSDGLKDAWAKGMERGGLEYPSDQTSEERAAMFEAIQAETDYIAGLVDFVMENSKAEKGVESFKRSIQPRMSMWANRWRDLEGRAFLAAKADAPLSWHLGSTQEHCENCAWANGRTYRGSVWAKYNWRPQSPNLACKGFNCDCELSEDGNKPMRGHPVMLSGGE